MDGFSRGVRLIGRGEGRRSGVDGIKMAMKWTTVLNVIQDVVKAYGTGVELAVNSNMSQAMAMEACFIIAGVIQGEECMSKITGPMGLTLFYSL